MRFRLFPYFIAGIIFFEGSLPASCQENILTHYFSSCSFHNPALAGNTRYAQVLLAERLQPTVSNHMVSNTLISFDYKLQNQRSGVSMHMNRNLSIFNETQLKASYSHTFLLFKKYWMKTGMGISVNTINTHATTYKFPDQYNQYGFTGLTTNEPSLNARASYPGFSSGVACYNAMGWISVAVDNMNRPKVDFAGEETPVPILVVANAGYLFPLDKAKRPKRIFDKSGGIKPYSSLGPVVMFNKNGPYQVLSAGVHAFNQPVFWGISYRYNSIHNRYFSGGVTSVNLLAGYRIEVLSFAYSYDFVVNRTPTNFRGAHEISLIYYFYSVVEDYKKYRLFPYPNQLMY